MDYSTSSTDVTHTVNQSDVSIYTIDGTSSTISGNLTVNGTSTTAVNWGDTTTDIWLPDKLSFRVDDEVVEFQGKEILRLKEMLDKFIQEEHPEDLL